MENTEIVEANADDLTTSGKATAITLVALLAVGAGVSAIVIRALKKRDAKAAEKALQNEAEEAVQN